MANDPSTTITDRFQKAPYNFDVPPPGATIGALKAIFTAAGQAIADLRSAVLTMQQMSTVQTATGSYLDAHGALYGVIRISGEADDAFRTRILDAITTGKLTLDAIQKAVVAYYQGAIPSGVTQPVITVFDRRSNPTQAAADGLQLLDFEISIGFEYGEDTMWFLDPDDGTTPAGGYLEDSTYLDVGGAVFPSTVDAALANALIAVKAAGTHPVYKMSAIYIPGPTP